MHSFQKKKIVKTARKEMEFLKEIRYNNGVKNNGYSKKEKEKKEIKEQEIKKK